MSDQKKKEIRKKEKAKEQEKIEETEEEEQEQRLGILPNRNLKKNLGCGG